MDWTPFLSLAIDENWRISSVERRLFEGPWVGSAFSLEVMGDFSGFVTAVAHQRSGWIGNLIVPPSRRSRGYGRKLFAHALQWLEDQHIESCWLTASEQGQTLYASCDFAVIDQIERWVLRKILCPQRVNRKASGDAAAALINADRRIWGEERSLLLAEITGRGQCFSVRNSVLCLQQEGDFQLLGPWYSYDQCPQANRQLLDRALAASDPGRELVIDLLGSSPLKQLLTESGFIFASRSALMVRGDATQLQRRGLLSLASLGSVG